jgi:hypothetical protein
MIAKPDHKLLLLFDLMTNVDMFQFFFAVFVYLHVSVEVKRS